MLPYLIRNRITNGIRQIMQPNYSRYYCVPILRISPIQLSTESQIVQNHLN